MGGIDILYSKLLEVETSDGVSLKHDTCLEKEQISDTTNEKGDINSQELVDQYLTPTDKLSWSLLNELDSCPDITPGKEDELDSSMIKLPGLLNRTTIRFKRSGIDGKIISFSEELSPDALEDTQGASSLAFSRKFNTDSKLNVRGSSSNLPFMPGGLNQEGETLQSKATRFLHRDQNGLFDIPQGFKRGLSDTTSAKSEKIDIALGDTENMEELEILPEQSSDTCEEIGTDGLDKSVKVDNEVVEVVDHEIDDEIGDLIPKDTLFKPSMATDSLMNQRKRKTKWAHVVDLNHKIENFDELVPNPARTWPFELDIFQQEAVYHLEQGDSVFVAAHTSAGKTVVAEYAIAMAHKNMTKSIYTSPIKALSNQKFRDFRQTFDDIDVGVITGDVQINPEANCLIMTTEILRSMLYRGSDIIRDVEFVIFDEVHYVNDVDRGVVWEEVIIMLPEHVKIILLSATVPNTLEFASWVGRTKQKDIYVISTPKRPVPLEIFIFAKDTPFKVIDSNRKFLESGFKQHEDKFLKIKPKDNDKQGGTQNSGRGGRAGARGGRGGRGGARGGARGGSHSGNNGPRFIKRDAPTSKSWTTLVEYLRRNELLPVVIFVFSKKRCEEYAETLSGFNFSNAKESSAIHMFVDKAVSRLKKEDRELPQILRMREMLKRGIAVHHGGLLPIIKEVVEILFSRGLVKVLFATETFAMGLNLPTRTVVFSSTRKHDGTGFRDLLPGEFTQMSGRAGRRGLDKIGTVMIMAYQQPADKNSLKQVALGVPTKLTSQFRLTYTMILNLLRIEALKVEDMIKRSFGENSSQSMLPDQQMEILKLEKELQLAELPALDTENVNKLESIFSICSDISYLRENFIKSIIKGNKSKTLFKLGRLITFRNDKGEMHVGAILNVNSGKNIVDCLVVTSNSNREQASKFASSNLFFDPIFNEAFNRQWTESWNIKLSKTTSVPTSRIEFVSDEFMPVSKELFSRDQATTRKTMHKLEMLFKRINSWKEFDYHPCMNETTVESISLYYKKLNQLAGMLSDEDVVTMMFKNDNYLKVANKMTIAERIETIKQTLSDENLELLPEYNKRMEVLKTLNYIDPEQLTVSLKGRVACEINSGFELIITELVFENFLGGFSSEEIVALLSCFVYEGKRGNNDDTEVMLATPRLEKGKERICAIVEKVMELSTELKIQLTAEEDAFLENDRFGLVNTVYEWARGRTFKEIMEYANDADESEGTIVRVITFLDEICNQVKNAAMITGDSALHSKMTDAQEKIKRDIVFCASLYL
ncbi:unnamed protein product [Pichia kudriavzevii]